MIGDIKRSDFETWVECCKPPLVEHPLHAIAALMTSAAFTHPVDQIEIFGALADATAATKDHAERAKLITDRLPWVIEGKERTALPRALWDEYWKIIERSPANFEGELDLTLSVVALGKYYDRRIIDECEESLLQFDSVRNLITLPEIRLKTTDLENHAQDSLATDLLNMLTANGYDIEVIDADTVLLEGNYPAQNRTNRRILQLHDVWHLVGGYDFTPAGEVAISGFQLAQFGQNYSTRFLATVASQSAVHTPDYMPLLLDVMFDGWRHGRAAKQLMDAPWHQLIADPISQIRKDYGLDPIASEAVDQMEALTAAITAAA